jgi:uncharacterized protein (DUF1810 family)
MNSIIQTLIIMEIKDWFYDDFSGVRAINCTGVVHNQHHQSTWVVFLTESTQKVTFCLTKMALGFEILRVESFPLDSNY